MNRDLLAALTHASAMLQRAHMIATDAGREDIAREIRCAAVDVADAIVMLATPRAARAVVS